MHASDKAWIVLGAGVLAYDLIAPEGQTLSDGADRWCAHHKWMVRVAGLSLALHVTNLIGEKYDPVHGLFELLRRWRRINP